MKYAMLVLFLLVAVAVGLLVTSRVKSAVLAVVLGVGIAHMTQIVVGTLLAVLGTHPVVASGELSLWQTAVANLVVVSLCLTWVRSRPHWKP